MPYHKWTVGTMAAIAYNIQPCIFFTTTGPADLYQKNIQAWCVDEKKQWKRLQTLEGHRDDIMTIIYDAKTRQVMSCSDDATIRIWSAETFECLKTLEGHTNAVNDIAYDSQTGMLFSASDDTTVRIWSVETGKCLKVLTGFPNWADDVNYDTSRGLVFASSDNIVRMWSIETGECLRIFEENSAVMEVAYNSQRGVLIIATDATSSTDATFAVYSIDDDESEGIRVYNSAYLSMTYDPKTHNLIYGSNGGRVALFSIDTKKCISLKGHTDAVWDMYLDVSSRLLVTVSCDNSVRVWSLKTYECLKVFKNVFRATSDIKEYQFKGMRIFVFNYTLHVFRSFSFSQIEKAFTFVFSSADLFDRNTLRIVEEYWQ